MIFFEKQKGKKKKKLKRIEHNAQCLTHFIYYIKVRKNIFQGVLISVINTLIISLTRVLN